MDYYGPPPGEKPKSGMDLTTWVVLGAMALIAFGYLNFVHIPKVQAWQKAEAERRAAEAAASPSPSASPGSSPAPLDSASAASPESASAPASAPPPEASVAVFPFETPAHRMVLSNRGASLLELTFKDIRESTFAPKQSSEADEREAQLFRLVEPVLPEKDGVFGLAVIPEGFPEAASAVWAHSGLPEGGHRFSLRLGAGWELQKDYLPASATEGEAERSFHFRLVVRVVNHAQSEQELSYWLQGTAGLVNQDLGRSSFGIEAAIGERERSDGEVTARVKAAPYDKDDLDELYVEVASTPELGVGYYGLVTKYFGALVVPLEGTEVERAEAKTLLSAAKRLPTPSESKVEDGVTKQGVARGLLKAKVGAGQSVEHSFMIYMGPRQEDEIFEQPAYASRGLGELVYYGWALFTPIGRVLHGILQIFHKVVGNWGIAILCLTVLVRLLILPLSLVQQKSAYGMQKVTPELNALREKLSGKDGQMTREQQIAFSQAQMALFKKHGVNPIGCLGPIFLQMPIFLALYNVCLYSADLRGQAFFGWIQDLSNPDVLFRMPFALPFLDTNAFSLLPLILVCLYVVQQRLQPPPADPKAAEQQRIMKFIFPVFGLLFYTVPSGLLVYWVASTLWGIGEQKFVKNKLFPPQPPAAKAPEMPGLAKVGTKPAPALETAGAPAEGAEGQSKKTKRKPKKKRK